MYTKVRHTMNNEAMRAMKGHSWYTTILNIYPGTFF